MIQYNYIEGLDLVGVNSLGNEDWEVVGIAVKKTPPDYIPYFDVFVKRGRQGIEMMEFDENKAFYIEKSFNLGDSIIIIFLTIFTFILLGKMIYNWLFNND